MGPWLSADGYFGETVKISFKHCHKLFFCLFVFFFNLANTQLSIVMEEKKWQDKLEEWVTPDTQT